MATIAVLKGGTSQEREISLRSAHAVTRALTLSGYDVQEYDTAQPFDMYRKKLHQADVVFPVLHGLGGEDGTLQALLDQENVPYVGSDATASKHCFSKSICKQLLKNAGLTVAEGSKVTKSAFYASPIRHKPFVLKPDKEGSSINTFIVPDTTEFDISRTDEAFAAYDTMLLEPYIAGSEVTVGILGDTSLPVVEIIPPAGKTFDYLNKYNGKTQELCPPVHINKDLQKSVQDIALRAHRALRCRDFSRVDIIIDAQNTPYILEINTIPGLTEQSLYPKAAHAAGYSMQKLCDTLVSYALSR